MKAMVKGMLWLESEKELSKPRNKSCQSSNKTEASKHIPKDSEAYPAKKFLEHHTRTAE